jgi:uncharacterized membrane protein YqjE
MDNNDKTNSESGQASAETQSVPASDRHSPKDLSTVALVKEIGGEVNHLVSKQLELATTELRADLKREAGVLAGLGVAGLAVLVTLNLLLVTAVLALAQWMAGWMAGLLLSACTLFAAATIGLVSWRRRVRAPLERTRRTVKDDLQWSKERLA